MTTPSTTTNLPYPTLKQIAKAQNLVHCEDLLDTATSLTAMYRLMPRFSQQMSAVYPEDFFENHAVQLQEDMQLIQYQLFILGWAEKETVEPIELPPVDERRLSYALALSKLFRLESQLQLVAQSCLRVAQAAGYYILELHIKVVLLASLRRSQSLITNRVIQDDVA